MNEFVSKLNRNCKNRNDADWKCWKPERLVPSRKLYCAFHEWGENLCNYCQEEIVDDINSSFDTTLCDDCFDRFVDDVCENGGYVKGQKLLDWLKSTTWICKECEKNVRSELKENSAKDLESRVAAIENMLQKICQKMGIPKE